MIFCHQSIGFFVVCARQLCNAFGDAIAIMKQGNGLDGSILKDLLQKKF